MSPVPKTFISTCVHVAQGHFKPLLSPCQANPFHKPRIGTISVKQIQAQPKIIPMAGHEWLNSLFHSLNGLLLVFCSLSLLHGITGKVVAWTDFYQRLCSVVKMKLPVATKFWVRDASCAIGSGLPTWNASCMLAWGKTSDKTQKTGREPIPPLPKVKEKKKVNKGWIWQKVVSWTNGSSHRPKNVKVWGFQRCLAALDVTVNFKQHLIYFRSFENPVFHNPAPAQSFLAVLKHALSVCWQQPCHKSHPSGTGKHLTCMLNIHCSLQWIPLLQVPQ